MMATEHKVEMEAPKSTRVSEDENQRIRDDEMQLPEYKFDVGNVTDDDDDDEDDLSYDYEMSEEQQDSRAATSRRKIMSAIWVVLCAMATLNGRRMLMGGFREFVSFLCLRGCELMLL